TPRTRARSSATAPGLSETTNTIEGPTCGTSRSACRFVPVPEASTAIRASTPGNLSGAVRRWQLRGAEGEREPPTAAAKGGHYVGRTGSPPRSLLTTTHWQGATSLRTPTLQP